MITKRGVHSLVQRALDIQEDKSRLTLPRWGRSFADMSSWIHLCCCCSRSYKDFDPSRTRLRLVIKHVNILLSAPTLFFFSLEQLWCKWKLKKGTARMCRDMTVTVAGPSTLIGWTVLSRAVIGWEDVIISVTRRCHVPRLCAVKGNLL